MKFRAPLAWALFLGRWLRVSSFSHHAVDGQLRGSSTLSMMQASISGRVGFNVAAGLYQVKAMKLQDMPSQCK